MARRRKSRKNKHPARSRAESPSFLEKGFYNAYSIEPKAETPMEVPNDLGEGPLIVESRRRKIKYRNDRGQRLRVKPLNQLFSRFYEEVGEVRSETENETLYDKHREEFVYKDATVRLENFYAEFLRPCRSLLSIGCGPGQLMRTFVRVLERMRRLEEGSMRLRMLGIDMNEMALRAAVAKKAILFAHHDQRGGVPTKFSQSLFMDFLKMDLIDLPKLDLRRTCIGESQVDVVLASDLFRWVRRGEREPLLKALRSIVKETGYLLSLEFQTPPLHPDKFLSMKLAYDLEEFNKFEPMPNKMDDFHKMIMAAGFRKIVDKDYVAHNPMINPFPPLVSAIFMPYLLKQDCMILASGDQNKGDLGIGIQAGMLLDEAGFDVTYRTETPINLDMLEGSLLLVIGAARIERDFRVSLDVDKVPLCDPDLNAKLKPIKEELERRGKKLLVAGIKPEPECKEGSIVNPTTYERAKALAIEIMKRLTPY